MTLYERPAHYAASHIVLGVVAVWIPLVGGFAVAYQLLQFIFNVRTFPVEGRIQKGNSVAHTGLKLAEMGIGYAIGSFLRWKYLI